MLHYPSPPNAEDSVAANLVNASNAVNSRQIRNPNLVDDFITIRIWIKIEDDIANECLKKLFANSNQSTVSHTAIGETQHPAGGSTLEHQVTFNGDDQVYIDVSNV